MTGDAVLDASRVAPVSRLGDMFAQALPLDVAELCRLGPVLVVAPHPDDESLGCGGLLAQLSDAGAELWPVLVTDGTGSHRNSRSYDAAAREALRDAEWRTALGCLGLGTAGATRLGLADGDVPGPGDPRFASAVQRFRRLLSFVDPGLVVMPWRRDPHPDHRAANALACAAIGGREPPYTLEYLVWTEERAAESDLPRAGEVRCRRLNIGQVLDRKKRAIASHRTQFGEVITDDPSGFVIPDAMRERAEQPTEYFFESGRLP